MAKKPRSKRNPPGPRKKPGMMKILASEHFPGRITNTSKFGNVMEAIKRKLTRQQLRLFKKDIFCQFAKMDAYVFSGAIVHNALLRQVAHDKHDEDQMWFELCGQLARLSIDEWCLVTGLKYGVYDIHRKAKVGVQHRLRDLYFDGDLGATLKEFDARFEALNFNDVDDVDALKIALYYFADRVLNGRKDERKPNSKLLYEVDDLEYFRSLPWGRSSWQTVYDSLDTALNQKSELFQDFSLKEVKYNIYGFSPGMQAWLFEVCEGFVNEKWAIKTKKKTPRILKWEGVSSTRICFTEVYKFFNDKTRITKAKVSHDDVIYQIERIDHSIIDMKEMMNTMLSEAAAERKEQRQFRKEQREFRQEQRQFAKSVTEFINSYTGNSFNRSYSDTPMSNSYTVPNDVGDQYEHTPMSLSLYGDLNDDSVQILKEAHPGISKFGRPYRTSHVLRSPYLHTYKRVRGIKSLPTAEATNGEIDERMIVDINPLKRLDDPTLFHEFEQWLAGNVAVDREIHQSMQFYRTLLGKDSMGWLGDEAQWNNGDCDLHSLDYTRLNTYIVGREDTKSKPFADVDMVLIPINLEDNHWVVARVDFQHKQIEIYDSMKEFREDKTYGQFLKPLQVIFPQWLEDVGFYDNRPNLRSAEPWKLVSIDDVPQQQPGSGDCGVFMLMFTMYLMFKLQFNFDSWHGHYFRRKIAIDIFNGDIML
ncbi:hypothetical protein KPL70_017399 [Citrus sinensis]|nr:hypothetical protein KPL70_017399 [Citrus sinensis]